MENNILRSFENFFVFDSSVLVALFDTTDPHYNAAKNYFSLLFKFKTNSTLLIPPLVMHETVVALTRRGVARESLKRKFDQLFDLDFVVNISISELSVFKHSNSILKNKNQGTALRTHDFLIVSVSLDFDATIISFDNALISKVKPVYTKVLTENLSDINNLEREFEQINLG